MTCEPHARRELEEELAAETADVRRELAAQFPAAPNVASRVVTQYPPRPPVVDPDKGTITAEAR